MALLGRLRYWISLLPVLPLRLLLIWDVHDLFNICSLAWIIWCPYKVAPAITGHYILTIWTISRNPFFFSPNYMFLTYSVTDGCSFSLWHDATRCIDFFFCNCKCLYIFSCLLIILMIFVVYCSRLWVIAPHQNGKKDSHGPLMYHLRGKSYTFSAKAEVLSERWMAFSFI